MFHKNGNSFDILVLPIKIISFVYYKVLVTVKIFVSDYFTVVLSTTRILCKENVEMRLEEVKDNIK